MSILCLYQENLYNISMKKILLSLFVISFALPSQAWFWEKKDKALEAELQGKGYAGILPKPTKLSPAKTKVRKSSK